MGLYQKLFLYSSAALLAQCQNGGEEYMLRMMQDKDKMQAIYKKMDIDGDGKLSLNEIMLYSRYTVKDMAAKRSPRSKSARSMKRYDANGDGKMSFTEYQKRGFNPRELNIETAKFDAADKNKDGELDMDEIGHLFHPAASPDVVKAMVMEKIKRLDKDGDGKLNSKEHFDPEKMNPIFAGEMKREFAGLDVDGDGKLDERELYTYESGAYDMLSAFKAFFRGADTDKDSHLSLDEFHKHAPRVSESDAASHMIEWMEHHEL